MKRFISLMLLTSLLVSCSGGSGSTETTDPNDSVQSETTIDMSSVNELPDKKWDGREFRVLGHESPIYDQFNNFVPFPEKWTKNAMSSR